MQYDEFLRLSIQTHYKYSESPSAPNIRNNIACLALRLKVYLHRGIIHAAWAAVSTKVTRLIRVFRTQYNINKGANQNATGSGFT